MVGPRAVLQVQRMGGEQNRHSTHARATVNGAGTVAGG